MWILSALSDTATGDCHYLLCGRDYSVGRKDCDIVIQNDMSISRKHATLHVTPSQVPNKRPVITLEDLSRLGSLVGEKRVIKEKVILSDGTTVVFGTSGTSKFRVHYEPDIITTSCLDAAGKRDTRNLIGSMGGHMVNEWRKDCNLLVMSTLSITVKAICALIMQKSIVTPQYLSDLVTGTGTGRGRDGGLDCQRYLPPLAESQLDPKQVSFTADPRRQTLFEGRLFLFLLPKQFKKLSVAVELGGGTSMLLEKDCDSDMVLMDTACVMSCDPTDQSQSLSKDSQRVINHVMETLRKHKKRPVEECEIGYAVLYCSLDKYCNPNRALDVAGLSTPVPGQTLSQMDLSTSQLRAQDTQQSVKDQSQATTKTKEKSEDRNSKLPDDIRGFLTAAKSRKRGREENNDQEEDDNKSQLKKLAKPKPETGREEAVPRFLGDQGGLTRVKEEPVTPQRKRANFTETSTNDATNQQTRQDAHEDFQSARSSVGNRGGARTRMSSRSPSPVPEYRGGVRTRKSSRSPSPVPEYRGGARTRKNSRSPSPVPEYREGARTRKSSRSPSPVPENRGGMRNQKNRRSPSPAPENRGGMRNQKNSQSPSPASENRGGMRNQKDRRSPSPAPASRGSEKRPRNGHSPSPEPSGRYSAKSTAGSTKRGRQSRPLSQRISTSDLDVPGSSDAGSGGSDGESDMFAKIPTRKSQTKKRPSPDHRREDRPDQIQASVKDENGNRMTAVKTEPMDVPSVVPETESVGGGQNVKPSTSRQEARNDSPVKSCPADEPGPSTSRVFPTAARPTKEPGTVDGDCAYDKDLPTSVMVLETTSLICRQPRKTQRSDDQSKWQGAVLKNFKKFRKVEPAGSHHMPRVIGGHDLYTHDGSGRQGVEELLREGLENETQQSQDDREAEDLFRFTSKSSKSKAGSTRKR